MTSLDLILRLINEIRQQQTVNNPSPDSFQFNNPLWMPCPSKFDLSEKPTQCIIAATFAINGLDIPLKIWSNQICGFPKEIQFGWVPYGPLFIALENPDCLLNCNQNGINIIFIRAADLCMYHPEDKHEVLTKKKQKSRGKKILTLDELHKAFDQLWIHMKCWSERIRGRVMSLIFLMPQPGVSCRIMQLEKEFITKLQSLTNVQAFSTDVLQNVMRQNLCFSKTMDRMSHSPFTDAAYLDLAPFVLRQIARYAQNTKKLIVLDCDNTLWGGAVGELGPNGVLIDSNYQSVQHFFVNLQERGMLIALCSRNIDADVQAVFDKRNQEMPLKRKHIVGSKINWKKKSENIKEIVKELSIGLDSVVFVDDNPFECMEVESNCHGVCSIMLPSKRSHNSFQKRLPCLRNFLQEVWAFDFPLMASKRGTKEDKARTEMYRNTLHRNSRRKDFSTMSAFMASLNLWMNFEMMSECTIERVAQLTERTNQFNIFKQPLTVAEIQAMQSKFCIYTVTTGDRFCTHGLVGVMIIENALSTVSEIVNNNQELDTQYDGTSYNLDGTSLCLIVHTFLLSCRTLHLGIEHAMLRHVAKIAQHKRAKYIVLPWERKPRNHPAASFLFTLKDTIFFPTVGQKKQQNTDPIDKSNVNMKITKDFKVIIPPNIEFDKMSKNKKKKLMKKLTIEAYRKAGIKRKRKKRTEIKKSKKEPGISKHNISRIFGDKGPPSSGIVLITTTNAQQTILKLEMSPQQELEQHKIGTKSHAQKTQTRIGYRTPKNWWLHGETYSNIANGLAYFKSGTRVFIENQKKRWKTHELEQTIRTKYHHNTIEQGYKFKNIIESDNIKDYHSRIQYRSKIRHEMRLMIQKQNPDSYYQDVTLYDPNADD